MAIQSTIHIVHHKYSPWKLEEVILNIQKVFPYPIDNFEAKIIVDKTIHYHFHIFNCVSAAWWSSSSFNTAYEGESTGIRAFWIIFPRLWQTQLFLLSRLRCFLLLLYTQPHSPVIWILNFHFFFFFFINRKSTEIDQVRARSISRQRKSVLLSFLQSWNWFWVQDMNQNVEVYLSGSECRLSSSTLCRVAMNLEIQNRGGGNFHMRSTLGCATN